MLVIGFEVQHEGWLDLVALSGVLLWLRIGQYPGGNVSVLQSFERRVVGQKCIEIHFCQLHPFSESAIAALACVSFQPCLKLAVSD